MPCGASTPTGCARLFICVSHVFICGSDLFFKNGAFLAEACVADATAWTVASRNFPKQCRHYHRATGDGPQSNLPFAQAKQGPHDQHHGPVAHLGLWHVQWQPHGWHNRQAKARPETRPFGEASMPPGSTATSPRGTTAIWRRRDGMSGAGRGCRRLHGVAGSGSDKQPRALRGAAGSDPDRNQGGLLRDCDARPAAEVVCNGHGYVLAALFQHACGRHEHAPAGVADIDLCTPHGQRQPAQSSDTRATPRYLRSTRAGLR
jgi:hypothetical protein